MSKLRKLAGQTAVYGLSSILGRILGYLLVPLHTRVLSEGAYGSVVEFYSYTALLLIILTYGMETAFFRFFEKSEHKSAVFSTSFYSILFSSLGFIVLIWFFRIPAANLIRYPDRPEYILLIAGILLFDAINTIPFANLRAENKPIRFVIIRLTGIFSNIGLNLIFLLLVPFLAHNSTSFLGTFCASFYRPEDLVFYIFASNLISSGLMTLLFLPEILSHKFQFDPALWRKLMLYALPLLVFGLAGVVNEVIDRVLLKYLLPADISMQQLGIYGAVYKVSIIMTIIIQAYRYAAEPFFFAQQKEKDATQTYSILMTWFVMVTAFVFLGTLMYLDIVVYFVDKPFRVGAHVIPILLMANLFLGVYYNLSIWYKLTDKTKYGAYISLIGALMTLVLNFWWIPIFGYTGSAWATFIVYFVMVLISWFLGQKHYPVPYDLIGIFVILGSSVGLYFLSLALQTDNQTINLLINSVILIFYSFFLFFYKKPMFMAAFRR